MKTSNKPSDPTEDISSVEEILKLLEGFHRNQYVTSPKRPQITPAGAIAALKARESRLIAEAEKHGELHGRVESNKRIVETVINELRHIVEGDESGVVYPPKVITRRAKDRLAHLSKPKSGEQL